QQQEFGDCSLCDHGAVRCLRLLPADDHAGGRPGVRHPRGAGGDRVHAGAVRAVLAALAGSGQKGPPGLRRRSAQALRLAESRSRPNRNTKAAPPISTIEWMRAPMRPSPAKKTAQFLALTAIMANADTVIAVPSAMASTD